MEIKLSEGRKYVFCDPCYVVSHALWKKFLDETKDSADEDGHVWKINGQVIMAAQHTAFGDGSYDAIVGEDGDHLDFAVDSGTLGVVDLDYCLPENEWPPASDYHIFEGPAKFIEEDSQFIIRKDGEMKLYVATGDNDEERPRM